MGIKAKADFPDRVRDVTSYEGMQRRSEQGRNDKVGRLLAGMDKMTIPGGDGRKYDVIGRRSGGGLGISGKWGLVSAGDGKVRLAPGRVWDGDREVEITGLATAYTPAAGWSFWLEKAGASYGDTWTLELKAGAWSGAEYDFGTSGGLTLMSVYRKRLLSFLAAEPSRVPVDAFSAGLYVERHTGMGDLKATSSFVNRSGAAVAVLDLIPC